MGKQLDAEIQRQTSPDAHFAVASRVFYTPLSPLMLTSCLSSKTHRRLLGRGLHVSPLFHRCDAGPLPTITSGHTSTMSADGSCAPLSFLLGPPLPVLGGGGGFLQVKVKVSPGEMLEVLVGGGGHASHGEAGGAGGFNGGQAGRQHRYKALLTLARGCQEYLKIDRERKRDRDFLQQVSQGFGDHHVLSPKNEATTYVGFACARQRILQLRIIPPGCCFRLAQSSAGLVFPSINPVTWEVKLAGNLPTHDVNTGVP